MPIRIDSAERHGDIQSPDFKKCLKGLEKTTSGIARVTLPQRNTAQITGFSLGSHRETQAPRKFSLDVAFRDKSGDNIAQTRTLKRTAQQFKTLFGPGKKRTKSSSADASHTKRVITENLENREFQQPSELQRRWQILIVPFLRRMTNMKMIMVS